MEINKLDILTIFVLSIVFFSVATLNLGSTKVPINNWKTNGDTDFFIDIGKTEKVETVYFLLKNSSKTQIHVYTGSPRNWDFIRTMDIQVSYYSWTNGLTLDIETQYIGFNIGEGLIEIAEIAILDSLNQIISIDSVNSENSSDPNLIYLTDEQNLVQLPATYMEETFFDEIYFVRTAENYLNFQDPYEWTHPPLGKLIIASGITTFGFNPFGWRIMGVIFATLMIPLIYLIGKELFQTWIGGFAAAFLLAFDFMHFTLSRMATVDTYVIFFTIVSQLFFLIYLKNLHRKGWKNTSSKQLFFAILFFALGFSIKWIAIYSFVAQISILCAIRLKEVLKNKKISLSEKIIIFLEHPIITILECTLIAVLIYFLTYIPDILIGRTILDVFSLQGEMYNYHSMLEATHPFSSAWWSWPVVLRPIWLYVSNLSHSVESIIVLLGNPIVWWTSFLLIILAMERAFRKKSFECIFIVTFFFIHWIPYMLISRITFLYHFYINIPLFCLVSAYYLSKYWNTKWGKIVSLSYFSIVIILFGYFYPIISGNPTPVSWIDNLKWFPGWSF